MRDSLTVPKPPAATQRGLALLAVLLFILVTTTAASAMVVVYKTQTQREKEQELLFVGAQYRRAVASYYSLVPPGGARALPASLDVLLEDKRFPRPVQHLRRLYPDPMTGRVDWQLIRAPGGIAGVASQSQGKPLKRNGFAADNRGFEDQARYADWQFVVR